MRSDSARVAARVRDLLDEHGREPPGPPAGDDAAAERTPLGQRLAARVPVRLDPGRRGALAVGVAVLVAAVLTGAWLMAQRPRPLATSAALPSIPGAASPVGTAPPATLAPAGGSGAAVSPAGASAVLVVVDVAGKVHRPGLYRLPPGSRVDDALRAAGGPLAGVDLTSLNLAARVVDGQQVAVGTRGAGAGVPVTAGGATPVAGPSGAAQININTASLEQLEALPGVGPVLGQHILDWRAAHGTFATIDQLNDVTGIGDVKFAALRPLVSV
ncbi:MAG TPA: helix-hairpin-helix domain-containing protein [Jatrophihabitans sp.]|nr:helix-hairpin-helix domain-containing protein [Jatrophihabitans sp.]